MPAHLVDEDLVRRHRALPLAKRGNRLFVAIADPTNRAGLDALGTATGLDPEPVLVDPQKLATAIGDYRSTGRDTLLAELESQDAELASAQDGGSDTVELADEAPVVRYIHQTLLDAIESGASDIHFEPYDGFYRVRMRIDGILREARRPPVRLGRRFAARLKVMGKMDVTERRIPQDGRIDVPTGGRAVDFRVSTLPTMHGEKVALRVLDPASASLGIDDLGLEPDQNKRFRNALARPQGMVLVTGPTGSGKTVTVYAGLNRLNAEDRNIATVEDPVEINVDGINQVQVNAKVGLDFATALRAFLRQDPDVVVVGEMRDLETVETAIKAAQTGHLVLSTLHTNSAAETLTRLRTMGLPAYNIASSVSLIVAQRLARLLCTRCRRSIDLPRDTLIAEGYDGAEIEAGLDLFDANDEGCASCDHGFRGRTGIYEVMEVSPEIQRLILADNANRSGDRRESANPRLPRRAPSRAKQGRTRAHVAARIESHRRGTLTTWPDRSSSRGRARTAPAARSAVEPLRLPHVSHGRACVETASPSHAFGVGRNTPLHCVGRSKRRKSPCSVANWPP